MALNIETLWIGQTVYPDVPVWRAWYDGRPVVSASFPRLAFPDAPPIAYGMTRLRGTRKYPEKGQKTIRMASVAYANAAGKKLTLVFALTDNKVICAIKLDKRLAAKQPRDASLFTFPDGADYVNPDAPIDAPHLFFSPSGKLVVYQQRPFVFQSWFYDRPGDLAVAHTPLLGQLAVLCVETGADGVSRLFDTLPFLPAPPDTIKFFDSVTPTFRAAFVHLLAQMKGNWDDRWMIRGEPGDFAVLACRREATWSVAAVSATGKVLTFRMEELWLRDRKSVV